MEKILVTGAAGFIGSNLCERLLELGYQVTGVDNFDSYYDRSIKEHNLQCFLLHPAFTFMELDLCNESSFPELENETFEMVIHLASKAGIQSSVMNMSDYIHNNIIATQHILDIMKKKNIKKILFGSSSSVYGNSPNPVLRENDHSGFPLNPYGVTKKTCELLLHNYYNLFDFNVVILRFFSVYGRKQRPDLVMYKFANRILNDHPVMIYGDGNSKRDYTEVRDVVNSIVLSIRYMNERDKGYEIFNIGNGCPVSLNELVTELYTHFGKKEHCIPVHENNYEMKITCADISKAQKELAYSPQIGFKEGVRCFVNWYSQASFARQAAELTGAF